MYPQHSSVLVEQRIVSANCGTRFEPLTFRDLDTSRIPGKRVGYAVVPLNGNGDENEPPLGQALTELAGARRGSASAGCDGSMRRLRVTRAATADAAWDCQNVATARDAVALD